MDGNRKSIKTKVEKDGTVIAVMQEDEGEITVTRTDEDGEARETAYADEEELAAADPEAYELFKSAGESATIHLDLEGIADIDVDLDLDEWADNVEEWRDDLEEHLEEAGEAYSRAMESAHEALREVMERWQESGAGSRSEPWPHFAVPPMPPGKDPLFASRFLEMGKPRHTFTVKEDGSIEARIRKGDSELVRVFENEESLAKRNPKLYQKYQELIEAEE